MALTTKEIYERSRARAKGTESQKRLTATHREKQRRLTISHKTANAPSVVSGQQRIQRQQAQQQFTQSRDVARRQAAVDAENRRIARKDQLARRRIYTSGADSAISSFGSTGSYGETRTGQTVSAGSQTVGGGIFRVILVVVGLSLLYLMVSNGGQGGNTIVNGINTILSFFTNPSALFSQKQQNQTPSSLGAINTILNPLLPNPNAAQGPQPGQTTSQQILNNGIPTSPQNQNPPVP